MPIPDVTLEYNGIAEYLNLHFPNYMEIWNSVKIDRFIVKNESVFQRIKLSSAHQFERCSTIIETKIGNNILKCESEEYCIFDQNFKDGNIWKFILDAIDNKEKSFVFYGRISDHNDGIAYAVDSEAKWPSYLIVQRCPEEAINENESESVRNVFEKRGMAVDTISKEKIISVIELELPFFRVADNRVLEFDGKESIVLGIEANPINAHKHKWVTDKKVIISCKVSNDSEPIIEEHKLQAGAVFQQIISSKQDKIIWSKIEIYLKDLCVYSSEAYYMRSIGLHANIQIAEG